MEAVGQVLLHGQAADGPAVHGHRVAAHGNRVAAHGRQVADGMVCIFGSFIQD